MFRPMSCLSRFCDRKVGNAKIYRRRATLATHARSRLTRPKEADGVNEVGKNASEKQKSPRVKSTPEGSGLDDGSQEMTCRAN